MGVNVKKRLREAIESPGKTLLQAELQDVGRRDESWGVAKASGKGVAGGQGREGRLRQEREDLANRSGSRLLASGSTASEEEQGGEEVTKVFYYLNSQCTE